MWTLFKEIEFDAAHRLPDHPGDCSKLHGHRWKVGVTVKSMTLNRNGMVVDFGDIKRIVKQFDHKYINEFIPFNEIPPTAENLAQFLTKQILEFMNTTQATVTVTVEETPGSRVTYMS